MPGTITPAQMFDHELNPVKGWPSPYAVDKTGEIASGEAYIFSGRCCHLDPTSGKFKAGCPMTATYAAMPIFAFPNQTDYDVSSDVGNMAGGHIVGLVGNGAYELESTEYKGTGFAPNIPLTVDDGGSVAADIGKLKTTALNANTHIVGIVSDAGPLTNEFKKTYVRFWPIYLPVRP